MPALKAEEPRSITVDSDFTRSGMGLEISWGEAMFRNYCSILSKDMQPVSNSMKIKLRFDSKTSSFYYTMYYFYITLGKHLCKG